MSMPWQLRHWVQVRRKFAGRCPYATANIEEGVPCLEDIGNGHYVACFNKDILFKVEEGSI